MRFVRNARITVMAALTAGPGALLVAAQSNLTSPNTLDHTLHWLYIAAAAMGMLLLVVAALAYATYRRNQHEGLTLNDTDDSVK